MCSTLLDALLAVRARTSHRGALDRHWAALTEPERADLERQAVRLADQGVRAVLSESHGPLFIAGPDDVSSDARMLAVCGPAAASGPDMRLAEAAARTAVAAGWAVLAGNTAGAETMAVRTALDAGGLAVTVLAEGLHSPIGAAAHPRLLTVSPCPPGQQSSIDAVLARNAVIAGACAALVAVAAANTGATVDTAMRALSAGRPVLAVGDSPGSRLLVDYGAMAAVDEIELLWWFGTRLSTAAPELPVQRRPGLAWSDPVRGACSDAGTASRPGWRYPTCRLSTA